jgi:Na+/melibiose symporter-like transporter
VIGTLSDNHRSRFGRRHPFMLAAALPYAIGFLLIFHPPDGLSHEALFAWVCAVSIGIRLLLSVFAIPHTALGAELSTGYEERTKIASYRTLLGWLGGILLPAFAFAVLFRASETSDGRLIASNYARYAWFSAGAALLTIVLTSWWTRREIARLPAMPPQRRLSWRDPFRDVADALQNANFRRLFLALVVLGGSTGVATILGIYTATYFWGFSTKEYAAITLSSLLPTLFAFGLIRPLGARFEKKPLFGATLVVLVANALWWYGGRLLDVLPENGASLLLPLAVLHNFVLVVAVVVNNTIAPSMIADIADEHEVATGERKDGVFFAALAFAIKVPTGLGQALGGVALGWVGIQAGAQPGAVPEDVLFRLGLVAGPIVSASFLLPLATLARFDLSRARHAELRAKLEARATLR